MPNLVYNKFKNDALAAYIASSTFKVLLVTSAYTPNADHNFYSQITNEVAAGGGYTTGGQTLSGVSVSQDNTDDEGVLDANDVVWASATFTARGAVIYKDTGVASTSPLLGFIDFVTDKVGGGDNFTIQWNAEGILNLN